MRLIVGLGNPGRKYAGTRHNLGFRVCETLAADLGVRFDGEKFDSLATEVAGPEGTTVLLMPQTYMNLSGQAVSAAVRFYRLELSDLLVVSDDFNLPVGQIRLRRSGSHGGHNGLRHVIELLGTDAFPRLRLGTGPLEGRDPVAFCLTTFAPEERDRAERMVRSGADAARVWLESGIDEAMNRFNVTNP